MVFPFPIPPGYSDIPLWTEEGFRIGSERVRVLRYTPCDIDTGWDASLTDFHEKEVEAGNYYIDRASRRHTLLELQKIVTKNDLILLEIGSSSGYMLRDIRSSFQNTFIIGSDCISDPLENIAGTMPQIPVIQFDLVECPLPDSCIDIIVALNVMEHIEDDEAALQQIYRILKPGGYVIIEVPANQDLYDFFDAQLKHFRRYNLKLLCNIARKMNFSIVKASHFGFFIYPAFKFVKLLNQRKHKRNFEYSKNSVKDLIHMGGPFNEYVLYWVMLFELYLGKIVSYPTGIRCLLTLQKPDYEKNE